MKTMGLGKGVTAPVGALQGCDPLIERLHELATNIRRTATDSNPFLSFVIARSGLCVHVIASK
jgi:hypothetical protein